MTLENTLAPLYKLSPELIIDIAHHARISYALDRYYPDYASWAQDLRRMT
jgi:hypothetical protein